MLNTQPPFAHDSTRASQGWRSTDMLHSIHFCLPTNSIRVHMLCREFLQFLGRFFAIS